MHRRQSWRAAADKAPPDRRKGSGRDPLWAEMRERLSEAAQVDGLAAWRLDGLIWESIFEGRRGQ